jgi:DEAD/DEAH box helicase domain-containing protein
MRGGKIVLDLETQKTFDEVGGRNFSDLLISVVGVYRYDEGIYQCFRESQLHLLENLLIDSPLIIGFNHRRFDMPVLEPYLSMDPSQLPMLDILEDISSKIGHRVSLDSVAQATLNIGKTGDGLDAIGYFRKGEWEKLESYCLNDVKVTKEVYEYGQREGRIYYLSRDGSARREVEVDWQEATQTNSKLQVNQYNLGF